MAEADQDNQDISDDLKTNDELLDQIVKDQEAKLSNLQNRHEYELQQNQRRLDEYERTIRELQEKLQAIDEKTGANLRRFDEEGERFDKEEKEKLSRLHQRLRDDGHGHEDTLRRTLLDTHNDKVRLEEQNQKLLNDLHESRQMVASMKKGSRSDDKADGAGAQELIKSLEMKLNMEIVGSKKLTDKIEELHQRIESLQTASNETTEEIADSEEAEVQIDHPINSGEIAKWLKEGVVELKIKRINMLGPPGSGKTCSLRLLLNEDPPEEDVTDSTPIACRAVKATRISCSEGAWERIGSEALLEKLASDLAAYVEKHPKPVAPVCNNQQQGELMECESSEAIDAPDSTDSQNPCHTKILKAIKSGEKICLNQSWVYIVDSGGQPAFQELLPLFVRRASLNIVTLDLSQGLDQPLKCNFRIRGEMFPIDSFFASNQEFFKKVVCSGDMCPSNTPLPKEDTQCDAQPMHFILGTHFDQVTHEEFKEVNDALTADLSKSLSEDQVYFYKENESEMICPVNTLIPKGEERSQVSQKISKFIYNCVSRKLKIPIRWFAFDLFLQMEAKNKKSSYLEIQDVFSIGKSLQMNEGDTKEALKYLHEVTIILYYPQALPDIVFIDPCSIHDALTRLLSLTYVNRRSFDLILKEGEEISKQEVKNLSKKGLFTLDLFQKLPDISGILKSDLIELLCQLHIIAKIEKNKYFIPSALRCYDKPPLTKDIKPLVIVWLNQDNKNLLVPQGIFCSVIVQLINEEELKFSMPDSASNDSFIYRNAMSFQILIKGEGYVGTLHFINKYKHIELYFTGYNPSEHCPLVREVVMKAIVESSKKIRVDEGKPVPAFACPETEGCYCLVIDEKDEQSRCTVPKSAEVIEGQESYWNWFHAPRHNNSEVCHTHLDIRQLDVIYCTLTKSLFSTSEWENLGYKLGLFYPTLSTIRSDRQSSDDRLREVLAKWLKQVDDASAATWPSLLKALIEAGQKDVANKIRDWIQTTA